MSKAQQHALVANATTRLGQLAVQALESAGWIVRTCNDASDPAAWEPYFSDTAPALDLIVTAPPADSPQEHPLDAIRTAWLGAKYALPAFQASGRGILLTLGHLAPENGASPSASAAAESIRMMTAAALHDAQKSGIVLRSNRLFSALDSDAKALQEAIKMLSDDRSVFMTGTELQLAPISQGSGQETLSPSADLRGKTVLVTGATSGIGRAMAIEMGRLGAWVAVGGRKAHLAQETLDMIRTAGGDGMIVSLDVTDSAAWYAAAALIQEKRGALHALVNNAGEAKNLPISQLQASDLDFLCQINCLGVQLGMDAMADLLAKGHGSVLNISSVAGIRAGPGGSAYSASKAAMIGLSRGYAARWAASGTPIRINTLQPGLIWSDSVADSLGEEGAKAFRAMIEPKTPLGRVGTPEDVAGVAAFLLTDAAAGINAQSIHVSGGLELSFP